MQTRKEKILRKQEILRTLRINLGRIFPILKYSQGTQDFKQKILIQFPDFQDEDFDILSKITLYDLIAVKPEKINSHKGNLFI